MHWSILRFYAILLPKCLRLVEQSYSQAFTFCHFEILHMNFRHFQQNWVGMISKGGNSRKECASNTEAENVVQMRELPGQSMPEAAHMMLL